MDMDSCHSTLQQRGWWRKNRLFLCTAFLLAAAVPLGAHAQDIAPITGTMTAIHGFLQSTAIRTLAAIAVIGVGITAMMGRMRWAWAGSVIGGIVLIFGADQFVSFFTTSAGG
ncbi:TrbC/VirB2 family protein [Nevskia soli]|uniref:TrbC/VirB2 family protein n=1 Tax=Nevskia soli TaxID=418856 RepID=UPI0014701B40|nr:TrbC/VirB2 family protein [Nevskia soli]